MSSAARARAPSRPIVGESFGAVELVRDPIGVIALSLIAILLGYAGGGFAKFLSRARPRAA